MNFNSLEFLLFLILAVAIYYLLGHRWQNYFLLAASYFFYGSWDWRFLGLVLLTTLVDYTAALRIASAQSTSGRRFWLVFSLVINLSILGFFKYFNFFVESFLQLLQLFGYTPPAGHIFNILLPIGISFYIFKSLSYTIDVYRRVNPPTRNLLHYALYVAFFPQLIAGPIERAGKLLPQFQKPRVVTTGLLEQGCFLILMGYLKKVLIADNLGLIVWDCFNHPDQMSYYSLLLGMYYFAFQIYCDFSGYSDIARGVANLLGMETMVNFRCPYFAQTIREFWTRWHISLSRWLRDYLYTSLAYKTGVKKLGRNLFITMTLCGLWHGSTWNFVFWGAFFGVLQWVEWPWLMRRGEDFPAPPRAAKQWLGALLRMAVVFHLVCFSWIFFRADTLAKAGQYLAGIFSLQSGIRVSFFGVGLIGLAVLLDIPQYLSKDPLIFLKTRRWLLRLGYVAALLLIMFFGGQSLPFIYFKF